MKVVICDKCKKAYPLGSRYVIEVEIREVIDDSVDITVKTEDVCLSCAKKLAKQEND